VDLAQLLDFVLPAKRHQGLSGGQYLLLAAINRAVSPTSKLQFADWYQQTVLTRLLPAGSHPESVVGVEALECQRDGD
jgi:hypothetical protein